MQQAMLNGLRRNLRLKICLVWIDYLTYKAFFLPSAYKNLDNFEMISPKRKDKI